MKCPDCGKTGIKAKGLGIHRFRAHVAVKKAKATVKAESNGQFTDAVNAEIMRINAELVRLGDRRDLLEQLK